MTGPPRRERPPEPPEAGDLPRETMLPYGRQEIRDEDVAAVVEALRSDWLTTGPRVPEFEAAFAGAVGARHAVAVSSGTAALHVALAAADVGPGDDVIVAGLTFAASSNAVLYVGARPIFADVEPDTLLIAAADVEAKLTPRTKAVVAVDYAGQPCDWDALNAIAARRALVLVDDACHAIGGVFRGRPVGTLADLNCFSFHPVKQITTGEGGMVTTADAEKARTMRAFRNHGITTDHRERVQAGTVSYDMVALGFNYRLTDFQAALGSCQLTRLPEIVRRRRELAALYDEKLAPLDFVEPLRTRPDRVHAYHLYVVRFDTKGLRRTRDEILAELRARKIGANVHYRPPYLHPYYRERLGTHEGLCPVAEEAADRIVTLPLFPQMTERDVDSVIAAIRQIAP